MACRTPLAAHAHRARPKARRRPPVTARARFHLYRTCAKYQNSITQSPSTTPTSPQLYPDTPSPLPQTSPRPIRAPSRRFHTTSPPPLRPQNPMPTSEPAPQTTAGPTATSDALHGLSVRSPGSPHTPPPTTRPPRDRPGPRHVRVTPGPTPSHVRVTPWEDWTPTPSRLHLRPDAILPTPTPKIFAPQAQGKGGGGERRGEKRGEGRKKKEREGGGGSRLAGRRFQVRVTPGDTGRRRRRRWRTGGDPAL